MTTTGADVYERVQRRLAERGISGAQAEQVLGRVRQRMIQRGIYPTDTGSTRARTSHDFGEAYAPESAAIPTDVPVDMERMPEPYTPSIGPQGNTPYKRLTVGGGVGGEAQPTQPMAPMPPRPSHAAPIVAELRRIDNAIAQSKEQLDALGASERPLSGPPGSRPFREEQWRLIQNRLITLEARRKQILESPESLAPMKFDVPSAAPVQSQTWAESAGTSLMQGLEEPAEVPNVAALLDGGLVTPEVANRFAMGYANRAAQPVSRGTAALNAATQQGAGSIVDLFLKDPGSALQGSIDLTTRSLGATGASLAAAPLAGAWAPLVVGAGSMSSEAINELGNSLSEEGVNPADAAAVLRAMNDPVVGARVRKKVLIKSGVVGIFDALTAKASSMIPGGKTPARMAASHLAGLVVEMAGGAGGEAASQLASGKEFQGGDVLMEALAELLPGAATLAGQNVMRPTREAAAPTPVSVTPQNAAGPAAPAQPGTPTTSTAAPTTPVDDRYSDLIRMATDRLRARAGGATDAQIVEAIQTMTEEDRAKLFRDIGLVADEPAKQPATQTPPPAPRRGGNTLSEILANDREPPEVRYSRGEITRDEMVAELEAAFAKNPSERARREFEEMGKRDEERRRGDSNEGGVVSGGVRGPGPVEGAGGGGVAVPVDVRAVGGGVASVVGGEGSQAGDQPGDVVGGRSDAEVDEAQATADSIASKYQGVRLELADMSNTYGRPTWSVNAIEVKDRGRGIGTSMMRDLAREADSRGVRLIAEPTDELGGDVERLQAFYRNLGFVENADPSVSSRLVREPQQPGAVTAAPKAQETTNEEEGHQEGRPERLLTKKPAAPETATTGVERESLTLGSILQAFDDPDSVDTAMSEKDLADAIEAYLVNNENESLASALEQYRQNRRDHVEEFGRRDDDGADALVQAVRDEASRENVPSKLAPGQVSKPRYLHEMTLAEHRKEYGADKDALHRIAVDKAIELGHKIPASVIADYADLSQPSIPPPPAGAALAAPSVFDADAWKARQAEIARRVQESRARSGLMHLDDAVPLVPKGRTVTSLRDGSTGVVTRVASDGDVEVRWSDNESAAANSAGGGGTTSWVRGDERGEFVLGSRDDVYKAFPSLRPPESPQPKITEYTIELNSQSGQSPDLDAMSPDELKAYAKSIGVPPRGSPAGIRARIRKAQADQLSAKDNPAKTDSSLPKGQTPEYDALPAATREQFEAAYAARDVDKLAEYLHPSNKVLRREFAARAGMNRVPPGVTRTRAAVEEWATQSVARSTGTALSAPQTESGQQRSQSPSAPSAAPVPSRSSDAASLRTPSPAIQSEAAPAESSGSTNRTEAPRRERQEGRKASPQDTREPWEMTMEEFRRAIKVVRDDTTKKWRITFPSFSLTNPKQREERLVTPIREGRDPVETAMRYEFHRDFVATALRSGKPVPAEVLKDYPDLTATMAGTSQPNAASERPAGPSTRNRQASTAAPSPAQAPAARFAPATATGSSSQTQSATATTRNNPSTAAGSASSPKSTLTTLSPEKEARLAELKKRLAAKLNTELRSGFDPELFAIGAEMTALYVEKGARSFASFARQMVADLGDAVKPYLKAFYNGARDMPGVDASGMDDAATVGAADIEAMLRDAGPAGREPSSPGDRPQDTKAAGEVVPSGPTALATPPRVKKYREMADRLIAKAEALEKNSSRRFDDAPGAAITGGSGRHRSGLHKKTERAIEGSLNDLQKAKRLREAAGKWNARADNLDPEVIRQREERKAVVLEAREKVKAKESAERKAAPIINEDGDGVLRITAAEWKKADKDYKGLSIRDGVRVRTLLRGGTLHEVFITDMPVKTRAEAKADATVPNPTASQPPQPSPTPTKRRYDGDTGSMKSLGMSPAKELRLLTKNRVGGWYYVETHDGVVLVDPFDDYGVRFVAENERSGSDLLRARTEAKAYADDHPVEKKPWQMTRAEFRERDEKLRSATEARDRAQADLGGGRWGETRRFQGKAAGLKLERLDAANRRWSKAFEAADAGHRVAVERAAAEGLPVPEEVRKEYGIEHPAGELVVKPIGGGPSERAGLVLRQNAAGKWAWFDGDTQATGAYATPEEAQKSPQKAQEAPPTPSEPKQPSAGLQRARDAKAAKTLDETQIRRANGKVLTRRQLVDAELSEGSTPRTVEITDTAAVTRATDQKRVMDRRIIPTGNEKHQETIRYRELEATIKNPPKVPEYRMVHKDASWRVLTKAEYDYAVTKKLDTGEQAAKKENDPYAADIEKLTAILRKQVATETSPRRQGQAAIVVLNGEAPAVQDAVAKVLWEIAPAAAEYVASDGPIGMRGRVAKAKPAATTGQATTESRGVEIVGDAERIDFDDGTSMLRHTLSDGTFIDETPEMAERWRPVGPGRQSLGQYLTVEEARRAANTRTVTTPSGPATESGPEQKTATSASPAVTQIGKYRVFERPGEGWAVNFDQDGAIQGRRGLKSREEAESLARQWDARDQEIAADRRKNYPMTLAEYPKVRDRIMSGDQTAEEHKELARWLMRSESAIKAELGQKTLKQLAPNGTGGNTKSSIIDTIYRNMLGRFHLGDSVSYNPFGGETYESALIKLIEATTDEDIRAFKEKRQTAVDARKKALENPETLDEFRQFIAKHGEASLTQDQRKRLDELQAVADKRIRGDDRPDYIAKVDTGSVQLTIKEGFHEKAKIPLWTVQMSGRVESDVYKALSEAAKKLGGWWSSFKKDSTGFQFKTKAAAEEFVKVNQQSITTEVTDKAREESQAEKAAARLIAMADEKIDAADEELGRERNTNTVRRARMADSAEAGARKAKQLAETLANIAEGIQNGTAKALRGIRNMTQLGELERVLMLAQREYWYSLPEESRRAIDPSGNWWNLPMDENVIAKAVMPMPEPHISHVKEIAGKGMTTAGIKREAAKLDKLWRYSQKRNPDSSVVKIDNPYDFNAAKAVAMRLKGAGSASYSAESVYDALMHHQRVADMGIKSSAEMRVALREYVGFRAGQAKPDALREMERGLIGTNVGIDFFPTPPALATEIVEKADIEPGMKVLEPSAGNGRLADAIKAAGANPDVLEVSSSLRAILTHKGHNIVGHDFTEYAPGPVYDRIVMNPPFSNRMDVDHVRRAYDMLKPGGRLVAIMSEGPFFGKDRKASEFRDWLDTVGTSEQLPEGSFQIDKSGLPTTGVNSRVVVIDKPQAGEASPSKMTISYGSSPVSTVAGPSESATESTERPVTASREGRTGGRESSDPLHDKVMAFRERLASATKRADLTGMEDEARMLADAADRANRSDLITMARGFIGQVQEKSGRLAAQEYRDRQAAKSGVLVFDDLPSRSEELSREYAGMGYQNGGLTTTLEEAQKRIRDNGIEADIAKESDGYRILRKYKGTPVLTPGQRDTIREAINRMGGLARLDGLSVSRLNNELDPPLRYLAMRYIANQDVPRVGVEAKNTAHSLMGEAPTDPSAAPDTASLADQVRKKMETEKRSRSAFYRSTGSDPEAKAKHRVEEERLKREADAMAPEIVRATEAAIGEYPGDIPNERMTKPAANTAEATEAFRAFEQANDDMEGLWAEEREIDREVASKKYGTKVREAAEKRRDKLRTTIDEAKAEWTKKRDAMIRMRQEHAWNGPDLWRKLGVMASWFPGRYTEVAGYLTKAAEHLVGTVAPELSAEDVGIVARDAVSNFLESPLGDSLTARIEQKMYVFTKKANQRAAMDRVEAAAPLQSHERSKFIRYIEGTDDKAEMDKIAAEAEAMAAERNAQEAEAERIRAEAEAKQKEANTAALTDPAKMRATTARQALGKRAQPTGSPVNGSNKLAVWMANAATKPRSQIEALGEEPVEIRGNPLTPEAMARMADSLADKATLPATLLGAVGKDGEPLVLFAYGKDEVGAVNGKMWAYVNTLGDGEWFTDETGGVLVLKSGGKPLAMVAGIKGSHVPPVNRSEALKRAGAGWKGAVAEAPKTYLTPKTEAPSTAINESAYPTLDDLGIKTKNAELDAKANEAARAYDAALEAMSEARNKANTSLTDDVILAKARAMSGDDNPSQGFTGLAIDKLLNDDPGLKAAQAAVEAARKAKQNADNAAQADRERASSAFKGEAEDKYREMVKDRKWWQHDAEANALERLWYADPRIAVLRKMAESTANAREIDTTGEILPPDFKPGVGVGNVSEARVDTTTDKPAAFGMSAADIGARVKRRGKADWTIELTNWPGDSSDPNGAWLAGDRLKPVEQAVKLAKLAPEFGADPVLTAKGDRLVWQAGNESFSFVNPWFKSAEEPGPIAEGQAVRIDVDTLKNLRGKVWARPVADTVAVAESAPAKKSLTLLEKLERISSDAKARIKRRGIQNRGRTSGATTLIDDTLDLAVVVAAEAARAGITGGRKLTTLVSKVVAELRSNGTIKADRGVDEAAIRRVARGLIRDGGTDEAKLVASYADAREAVERARTRRVGKALGDTKGVRAAVANAARTGRPEIAKPAEGRAKTFLEEVQRGPFREESARKAGEDAGFVEGLGVGKQLGEHKTRTAAAREIMRARREGHRAGVNQASAAIPSLIRQARNAFKRGQQVGKVEARSQVQEQATKSAVVDGLRKQVVQLAESLPPSLRGRYLRAAATVKTPSNVVAVLNRMRRDVSKYNGRQFMRGVERLAVGIPKLTEDRRYEARKALTAARAAFTIIKQSGASADELLRASTDIQAAYAEMAKHATEQRNEDKVRLVRRAVSAAEVREEMTDALGKKKPLPAGDTPGARDPGRVVLWLRKYANVRTMSHMLDGDYHGKGPFHRLYKAMARGRRLALGMQHGFQDAMEGLVRKRGYKDMGEFLARVSGTLGSASQETIDVSIGDVARNPNGAKRLTLGQAMYIYALDAATRAKAHAGQMFTFGEDPDGPKFRLTDDDFNRVEAALTADQKALVDEIKKEYDRTFFDRLSEVNKRLNGVYLDKVAGYWGIKRAMKQSDNPDVGKGWEQLVVRALHNAAMLQERIGGSAPIVIGDFGVDVLRRSESASTIVHKADLVRAIGKTALSPKVREEINARWGKTAMERLERVVIEYAGNQLPAIDQGIRGLMSNVARAKTQLNPTTWLRNISSVFMLQAVMPYSTIAKGMGGLFNVGAYRELMRYSPELRERWSGAGGQIAYMVPGATSHGSTGAIDASKATIRQVASATKALAGMNGLEFRRRMQDVSKPWKEMLDALTIGNVFDGAAATVAYKGYLAEAPATLSPEDQKRWAARRATEAFQQTANTNDLLNSTGLQEDARSSTIIAGLLAFTSDIAKKQNVLWIARKRGWQAMSRATAGVAMSMAWSVLVAWAFAALLGGDDDEREKAAKSRLLDEAISLLPGGTIIRRATSPYGSAGILDSPLTGVITQLALGMDKVYKGMSDDDSDRLRDGLFRLFQSGSDLTGAPFGLWAGMLRKAFRQWGE